MSNCKNCGAPVETSKCEYCGTVYGIKAVPVKKQTINIDYKFAQGGALIAFICGVIVYSKAKYFN